MKFTSCWIVFALITFQLSVVVYSLQIFQSSYILYKKTSQILPPLQAIDSALTPILAGALAGSFGVGASYPLDSVKTKAQAYASERESGDKSPGMLKMINLIYKNEGIKGFYQGVLGVMAGQAIIKSIAFSANSFAINSLLPVDVFQPSILHLCIAGAFSGFVASFVVNPIERIKVLMQADRVGKYRSELNCLSDIIRTDGYIRLVTRGLDATLLREVPSYAIYFLVYTILVQSPVGTALGSLAPLVCGASAGMACWIPVYPFDVIKTNIQNTPGGIGSDSTGILKTALYLKNKYGLSIFFDGLSPKLARAAVNHAVTFYVYDAIMHNLQ